MNGPRHVVVIITRPTIVLAGLVLIVLTGTDAAMFQGLHCTK